MRNSVNTVDAIVEGLQHLGIIRIGWQPETGLQRGTHNHAFDRAVLSYENEGHAASVSRNLCFKVECFHGEFVVLRRSSDFGMTSHDLGNVLLACLRDHRASNIGHQSMRCFSSLSRCRRSSSMWR